jgi:hypothetical protein
VSISKPWFVNESPRVSRTSGQNYSKFLPSWLSTSLSWSQQHSWRVVSKKFLKDGSPKERRSCILLGSILWILWELRKIKNACREIFKFLWSTPVYCMCPLNRANRYCMNHQSQNCIDGIFLSGNLKIWSEKHMWTLFLKWRFPAKCL